MGRKGKRKEGKKEGRKGIDRESERVRTGRVRLNELKHGKGTATRKAEGSRKGSKCEGGGERGAEEEEGGQGGSGSYAKEREGVECR